MTRFNLIRAAASLALLLSLGACSDIAGPDLGDEDLRTTPGEEQDGSQLRTPADDGDNNERYPKPEIA